MARRWPTFAAASTRPYANSLSADFARLIPNSTDVVEVQAARLAGTLNYAITGNETRYHSPGDDLAHLDRRSVAHMGNEVLAATRRMAAGPAALRPAARRSTPMLPDLMLLKLPLMIAAILLGGLVVVALALVHRRKAWKPLGWAALAFVASIAVAAIVATAIGYIRPGDYWRGYPCVADPRGRGDGHRGTGDVRQPRGSPRRLGAGTAGRWRDQHLSCPVRRSSSSSPPRSA